MDKLQSRKTLTAVGQGVRITGACTLAALLGFVITEPVKQAVGTASYCRENPVPATIVVVPAPASNSCSIALSTSE